MCIAAAAVIPTVVTGILAGCSALEGQRLKGVLLVHIITASAAAALRIITSWWLHWRARHAKAAELPALRLRVEVLGVAAIALTAQLGGFASGVNF